MKNMVILQKKKLLNVRNIEKMKGKWEDEF